MGFEGFKEDERCFFGGSAELSGKKDNWFEGVYATRNVLDVEGLREVKGRAEEMIARVRKVSEEVCPLKQLLGRRILEAFPSDVPMITTLRKAREDCSGLDSNIVEHFLRGPDAGVEHGSKEWEDFWGELFLVDRFLPIYLRVLSELAEGHSRKMLEDGDASVLRIWRSTIVVGNLYDFALFYKLQKIPQELPSYKSEAPFPSDFCAQLDGDSLVFYLKDEPVNCGGFVVGEEIFRVALKEFEHLGCPQDIMVKLLIDSVLFDLESANMRLASLGEYRRVVEGEEEDVKVNDPLYRPGGDFLRACRQLGGKLNYLEKLFRELESSSAFLPVYRQVVSRLKDFLRELF